MWRDRLTAFRRLFRYRMAYGDVIPPDARVDPAAFSEREFPLRCPDCDYWLRGLPEDRCPECGYEYERGRLLVQQYVIEGGKRLWKRTSRYAKWTGICGFLLAAASPALWGMGASFLDPAKMSIARMDLLFFAMRIVAYVMIGGCVLLFVSSCLFFRLAFVSKRKCKAVFAGIDRSSPPYQAAQQRKWVLWVIWGAAMAGMVAWEARDSGDWRRYYSKEPSRFLLPVAVAVGLGIALYIGRRLWQRWSDDGDAGT